MFTGIIEAIGNIELIEDIDSDKRFVQLRFIKMLLGVKGSTSTVALNWSFPSALEI
jgi:riboflavin synthase alpha subunit